MARTNKKKCLECGDPELFASITLTRFVPLADRNGTIKIGGVKIGQIDLKNTWDADPMGEEKKVRGPIFCGSCNAEHFYVVGSPNPLRLGCYLDYAGEDE